jgi:hypothetical protein
MTHFVGTLPEFPLLDVCNAAFPGPFGLIDALKESLSLPLEISKGKICRNLHHVQGKSEVATRQARRPRTWRPPIRGHFQIGQE